MNESITREDLDALRASISDSTQRQEKLVAIVKELSTTVGAVVEAIHVGEVIEGPAFQALLAKHRALQSALSESSGHSSVS
jgi:hypothetical protein